MLHKLLLNLRHRIIQHITRLTSQDLHQHPPSIHTIRLARKLNALLIQLLLRQTLGLTGIKQSKRVRRLLFQQLNVAKTHINKSKPLLRLLLGDKMHDQQRLMIHSLYRQLNNQSNAQQINIVLRSLGSHAVLRTLR